MPAPLQTVFVAYCRWPTSSCSEHLVQHLCHSLQHFTSKCAKHCTPIFLLTTIQLTPNINVSAVAGDLACSCWLAVCRSIALIRQQQDKVHQQQSVATTDNGARYARSALQLSQFTYTPFINACISVIATQQIDNILVLSSDAGVEASGRDYRNALIVAWLVLVVVGIGLPVLCTIAIRGNKFPNVTSVITAKYVKSLLIFLLMLKPQDSKTT